MKFSGTVEIKAPRERVWAFVIDPEQVGQCGPGVATIETVDPTHFRVTAAVGIAFVRARFVVNLELADLRSPERAVIKARGQAPGSAVDATAEMMLAEGPTPDSTVMDWAADVVISGALTSVGSRIIEGTANRIIAEAFDCIRARLEA